MLVLHTRVIRPHSRVLKSRFLSEVPVKFSDAERNAILPQLKSAGWDYRVEGGRDMIQKTYLFQNFSQAFAFMTEVAFQAEAQAHHPEWFNVYNRLNVVLSTHDCSGFSKKDVELATTMDKIYNRRFNIQ